MDKSCSFFENEDELKKVLDTFTYDDNFIKQVCGYLISGDPGYLSSKKGARKLISKYDRSEIIEFLLRSYYR